MKFWKYLLIRFSIIFILTLLASTLIFQIVTLVEEASRLGGEASLTYLLYWELLKTGAILYLLFPPSTIIASSILLLSLSINRELIALLSSGIPVRKFLLTLSFTGIIVAASHFLLGEFVVPYMEKKAQEIYYTKIKKLSYQFRKTDKVWLQSKNCICRVGLILPEEKALKDLTIIKFNDELRPVEVEKVWFATYIRNKWLFLKVNRVDYTHRLPSETNKKFMVSEDFPFSFKSMEFLRKKPSEMNIIQLYRYIRLLKQGGYIYPYIIAGFIQKITSPLITIIIFLLPAGFLYLNPRKKNYLPQLAISIFTGFAILGINLLASSIHSGGLIPYVTSTGPFLILSLLTWLLIKRNFSIRH